MHSPKNQRSELKKSCSNCGAAVVYAPGTNQLECPYCNHKQEINNTDKEILELELKKHLATLGNVSHSEDITLLHCKNCGANQHIEENYKSLHCVYCSMPLIVEDTYKETWIVPGAVLPFQINSEKGYAIFKKWVNGLWFAPNKLKKAALRPENIKGLYVPYWTFDADLAADYTGQRGDYYYVSVPYTTTVNGKTVSRMRQERRTRWTPAAGSVSGFVDDTLIKASFQKQGRIPLKIAHWNLKELQPFNSNYLAGFITEKYTIPLKEGHLNAKEEANNIATSWAMRDIGGDTQRVHSIDVALSNETFKHILLPVYVSAYQYRGKTYNFFINGQTGALSGKRPYSFWKIFFAILGVVLFFVIAIFLMDKS